MARNCASFVVSHFLGGNAIPALTPGARHKSERQSLGGGAGVPPAVAWASRPCAVMAKMGMPREDIFPVAGAGRSRDSGRDARTTAAFSPFLRAPAPPKHFCYLFLRIAFMRMRGGKCTRTQELKKPECVCSTGVM